METIKWSAIEYEEKERGNDWYWALGIIVVAGSVASIIFENYFFAILLVLGGGCFVMFSIKKPEIVQYTLSDKGLEIKSQVYPYKNIKAFYVKMDYKPTLFLKSSKAFMPILSIPIENISPEIIRDKMLQNEIPEEEMKEHFSEKVIERLGL